MKQLKQFLRKEDTDKEAADKLKTSEIASNHQRLNFSKMQISQPYFASIAEYHTPRKSQDESFNKERFSKSMINMEATIDFTAKQGYNSKKTQAAEDIHDVQL